MKNREFLVGDVLTLTSKDNSAEYLVLGYLGYRPVYIGTSENCKTHEKVAGIVKHLNESEYCNTGKHYDISSFMNIVNNLISE